MATRLLCAVAAMMTAGVALAPTAGAQQLSDDASLGSLSVVSGVGQTKMTPAFHPDVTDYFVAAPSEGDMVTVNVLPNHDRATLEWIGRDADPNLRGHQVAVTPGTTQSVSVQVEAEDGETYGSFYHISVARASNQEKGWRVYDDILFDDIVDDPRLPSHYLGGLWADEDRVFASAGRHNPIDQKLYAFSAADSSQQTDDEFVLSGAPGEGIWSDGTTLWALGFYGILRAYNLSDGSEIPDWSADLTPDGLHDTRDVDRPGGIWSDGATIWVVDKDNAKVVAFALPTNTDCRSHNTYCRQPLKDFDLAAENDNPWGITAGRSTPNGAVDTWWVTNRTEDRELDNKIYAYNRSDGSRNPGLDFDLSQLDDISFTQRFYDGLAATDTIMYVSEYITNRIYSFSMPGVSGAIGPALVSSDTTLSDLSLRLHMETTDTVLNQEFSPEQTDYTAQVEPDDASITVTATPNPSAIDAVVWVGETIAANGVVALNPGTNGVPGVTTIEIVVTAQDGKTKTYTVEVHRRAKSTDATLSSLVLTDETNTEVTLTSAGTNAYTATVEHSVAQVTVKADPTSKYVQSIVISSDRDADAVEANSIVKTEDDKIDYVVTDLTLVAQEIDDPVVNTIAVVVTDEAGSTPQTTYTVTVERERHKSSVTTLRDLFLMYAAKTIKYRENACDDTATNSYDLDVAHGVTSLMVQYLPCDGSAKDVNVFIENDDVTPREEVDPTNVMLAEGVNTLTIEVIADDDTTKEYYEVAIDREAKTDAATLESLSLNPGTLDGVFDKELIYFYASVGYGDAETKLTILPTGGRDNVTVDVQHGGTLVHGQGGQLTVENGTGASAANDPNDADVLVYTIPLAAPVGTTDSETTVTIEVTSESSNNMNVYVVDITRPVKADIDNATLRLLTLENANNNAEITLTEVTATNYTASVGNVVTQVVLKAEPTNPDAQSLQLQVNDIVKMDVDKEDLDPGAGVTVELPTAGIYSLKVIVTAEDGVETEDYEVLVTRDDRPLETDTTLDKLILRDLSLRELTLMPEFDAKATEVAEYELTVDHGVTKLEVIALATDSDSATVEVTAGTTVDANGELTDGTGRDLGGFVSLSEGTNIIHVLVTAENPDVTETYKVTVTRDAKPATDIDTLSSLTLKEQIADIDLATFDLEGATADENGIINFTVDVANDVSAATVRAVATSDEATVTVTFGETSSEPTPAASLDVRLKEAIENEITVTVTAEDGQTMKTYRVTVTRAASGSQPPGTSTPGNSNSGGGFVYPGGGFFNPGTGSSNPGTTTVGDSSGDGSDSSDDESDDVTPLEDAGDAGTETEAAINALHRLGLFTGTLCQSNRLCPNDPMQRWIAAVWLVRLIDGDDPPAVTESRFEDVNASSMWEESVWYAAHVERLAEEEITVGCRQDPLNFCPDVMLRRAQVASWLARAFDLDTAESQDFVDAVGSVHEANINAVVAAGVMSGCSTDPKNFCLDDTVTKGEMARYVYAARNVSLGLS